MTIPQETFGRTGHQSTRTIFGAAALARVTQEEADRALKTAAEEHDKTLESESVDVVMTDVKDYAVDLTLRFWVPPSCLRSSNSEVLKEITSMFLKHNVELAVPLRKYV